MTTTTRLVGPYTHEGPDGRIGDVERGSPGHFRVEFNVGEGVWHTNNVVFPTKDAAREAGLRRANAWTMVRDWRVVSDDTPLKQTVEETSGGEWA